MVHAKIKHPLILPAGLIASASLLTICQAPFDQSWAAWIAWVPFLLVCRPDIHLRTLLPWAYIIWLAYWLGNLYWLIEVTLPGYIAFFLVQACYGPLLALCVRFVRRKQWPLTVFAPLLMVGAEAWQGVLFTGFSWYFLAHSQYRNLPLIQLCDIFGQLGVSVLIGLVSGLITDLCLDTVTGKLRRRANLVKPVIVGLLLIGALIYGRRQLNHAERYRSDGLRIGVVQTNVPSHIKEISENGPAIMQTLLTLSTACFDAEATMTAWPETIVLAALNPDYLFHLPPDSPANQYDRQIRDYSRDRGYVLAGAHALKVGLSDGQYIITDQYNSAFLYDPAGRQSDLRYDKIHLVPFGEYIPFKESAPWIYRIILGLSPYDYDYNLTAGKKYTRFEIEKDGRRFGFGVLICYEDTDPAVCRKMVFSENQTQKADFLVNLSNDGWYVRYKEGKIYPSVELPQRAAITVFRCVENRIAVIRSVNTGISCLIDPDGRIRNDYLAGSLPKNAMDRKGPNGEGWFVDQIPLDARITFFTRHGRWLDFLLGMGLLIIFAAALYDGFRNRAKRNLT
jgi:apolipoprotein N-acyltransferase